MAAGFVRATLTLACEVPVSRPAFVCAGYSPTAKRRQTPLWCLAVGKLNEKICAATVSQRARLQKRRFRPILCIRASKRIQPKEIIYTTRNMCLS